MTDVLGLLKPGIYTSFHTDLVISLFIIFLNSKNNYGVFRSLSPLSRILWLKCNFRLMIWSRNKKVLWRFISQFWLSFLVIVSYKLWNVKNKVRVVDKKLQLTFIYFYSIAEIASIDVINILILNNLIELICKAK